MRNRNYATSTLGQLELFENCTPRELSRIDSLLTQVHLPAGKVLIQEGKLGNEFLIIVSGQAEVTKSNGFGSSKVADLHDGAFVGEISLLRGVRRTATVTATTDLTAYVSNPSEFREILRSAPAAARRISEASNLRSENLLAA